MTPITGSISGSILQYSPTGAVYSAASYPSSTTANQLLFSTSNDVVGGLSTANSSVLTTNGSGVPSWQALSGDLFGQYPLLAGRSGGQTLHGGTEASNSLTLDSTVNSTKGNIILAPNGGNVGIRTMNPVTSFSIGDSLLSTASSYTNTATIGKSLISDAPNASSGRTATVAILNQPVATSGTAQHQNLVLDMGVPATNSANYNLLRLIAGFNTFSGTGTLFNQATAVFNTTNSGTIANGQNTIVASSTNNGTASNQTAVSSTSNHTAGNTLNSQWGVSSSAYNSGTGVVTNQYGGSFMASNSSSGSVNDQLGALNNAVNSGGGAVSQSRGSYSRVFNGSIGTITNAYGLFGQVWNDSTGTVQTAYALYGDVYNPNGGTITTGYGIYTGSINATNKWSIYASDATAPSYFSSSVGIGTATPEEKLHVVGNIKANSTVYTSDVRYKHNIATIEHPLEKILALRGVTYDWKRDEFPEQQFPDRHQLGVIAQEVEAQFPQAVNTDKSGYKSVNYPALVAPLIEAVKELYGKLLRHNEQLEQQARQIASKSDKTDIENLRKENAELKARLDRLEKALSEK